MGSFSFTCAISGLPIEAGDRVRYYLLTENPYNESIKCAIHDLWFPRVWPLRAEYNDYGGVENVEGEAAIQVWLDALKLDLVERGWGDNSCHDTGTSKDMTFDQLREAVGEGRLLVQREFDPHKSSFAQKRKVPKGVPTRKRVEKVLRKVGFHPFTGDHADMAVMVSRQGFGRIRVRIGTFGGAASQLEKVEKALAEAGYATMLTVGTGNYSHDGEVLVRPRLGTKDYHYRPKKADVEAKPLKVLQAMIREDVWKALCTLTFPHWSGKGTCSLKAYRHGAQVAWDFRSTKPSKVDILTQRDSNSKGYDPIYLRDPIPFTVALAEGFKRMAEKADAGEMTPEEVTTFLDDAAEFQFLHGLLSQVRYQWRPSYSNGPQSGEWDLHEKVVKKLLQVTVTKAKEQRVERAKWGKA